MRVRRVPVENHALRKHYRRIRNHKRFLNRLNLELEAIRKYFAEVHRIAKAKAENPTLYPNG